MVSLLKAHLIVRPRLERSAQRHRSTACSTMLVGAKPSPSSIFHKKYRSRVPSPLSPPRSDSFTTRMHFTSALVCITPTPQTSAPRSHVGTETATRSVSSSSSTHSTIDALRTASVSRRPASASIRITRKTMRKARRSLTRCGRPGLTSTRRVGRRRCGFRSHNSDSMLPTRRCGDWRSPGSFQSGTRRSNGSSSRGSRPVLPPTLGS